MHRQYVDRHPTEIRQVLDRPRAAESRIRSAQFLRYVWTETRESLHVHFVDDGLIQGRARPLVARPVEGVIDHHRLRHSPRVITEVADEVAGLGSDHITK